MPASRQRKRIAAVLTAAGTLTPGVLVAEAIVVPSFSAAWAECTSIPSTADAAVLETVYRTARSRGVSDKVMLATFEAGWVESHMNNLNCGDLDSIGVFQQRDHWGSRAQRLDVAWATNKFLDGNLGPGSGAIGVANAHPNWTAGQVAQRVQGSAFPDRYDQSEAKARELIAQAKDLATGKQTVGYYQSAGQRWHMKNSHTGGAADYSFSYGTSTAKVVTGDWNKDGKTTPGYYDRADGNWHLRNTNSGGADDLTFHYPGASWTPVAGDWNNDGKTTVGFYDQTTGDWHLRNSLTSGGDDLTFRFGGRNMVPVVGDWDNDGKTTVGYYNPSNGTWHLRNSLTAGPDDVTFTWSNPGTPIAGDWNADGKTTVGFYRPDTGQYLLKNTLGSGPADYNFHFGPGHGATPIVGDWDNN